MPRPSNRAERRRQIIEGFRKVLSVQGYEKATIAAIAREAGLTSGLIHYHFSNKQEIMLELVGQLRANLEERFQRLLGERTTPQAKLAAFIDAHLGVGEGEDREAVACWVTIGTEALRQPEILEAYREQMSEQKSRLCSWLEELSSDGAEEKAAAILAAVEGCYQLAAAVPELTPPGFAAPTVRKMVEGLIGTNL